jgi:hypothetical protein
VQEAAEVYELIKGNFLLSQVFFELAREMPGNRGGPPLHALSLADMLRHTRLADGDRLVNCFSAITQAFRTIRDDPEAALFGFDQYGQVWIHQTTDDSIRALWEQLFHRQPCWPAEPASVGNRTGARRLFAASPRTERGYRSAWAGSGRHQLLNGVRREADKPPAATACGRSSLAGHARQDTSSILIKSEKSYTRALAVR